MTTRRDAVDAAVNPLLRGQMPDPTFLRRTGPSVLAHLAEQVGAQFVLDDATERNICLFAELASLPAVRRTKAAALVTTQALADTSACTMDRLLVDKPRLAFAMIQQLFDPPPVLTPWIAPQAVISELADLGTGCRIEPGAVIEAANRGDRAASVSSGRSHSVLHLRQTVRS